MKIGFVSLGCPKNLVDGEVMLGLAREAGHELTHGRRRRRRAGRQHLRLHRLGQAGVDRRHPRDGAAQARRHVPAAGRHRLPGRALSRRAAARRFRRSTPCSAPAKCRGSSTRSGTRGSGLGARSVDVAAAANTVPLTFCHRAPGSRSRDQPPSARSPSPRAPSPEQRRIVPDLSSTTPTPRAC